MQTSTFLLNILVGHFSFHSIDPYDCDSAELTNIVKSKGLYFPRAVYSFTHEL